MPSNLTLNLFRLQPSSTEILSPDSSAGSDPGAPSPAQRRCCAITVVSASQRLLSLAAGFGFPAG